MKNHKCDDPKNCFECFTNDYIKYGSSGRAECEIETEEILKFLARKSDQDSVEAIDKLLVIHRKEIAKAVKVRDYAELKFRIMMIWGIHLYLLLLLILIGAL